MSRYLTLRGDPTTSDDPQRGIWYAAGGTCGYWTDDWSKLSTRGGIPCCPECGCPGMQTIAADWFNVPKEFLKTSPRYDEWLLLSKEQCGHGISFLVRYRDWLKNEELHT